MQLKKCNRTRLSLFQYARHQQQQHLSQGQLRQQRRDDLDRVRREAEERERMRKANRNGQGNAAKTPLVRYFFGKKLESVWLVLRYRASKLLFASFISGLYYFWGDFCNQGSSANHV